MIDFLQVEQQVNKLKAQVAAGEIDQDSFEAKLLELVDVAEDGYYWMYGHNSEQWYRHNGNDWMVDTPPVTQHPHQKEPHITWDSVDLPWFFVSLVFVAVLASIIYSSAV